MLVFSTLTFGMRKGQWVVCVILVFAVQIVVWLNVRAAMTLCWDLDPKTAATAQEEVAVTILLDFAVASMVSWVAHVKGQTY